MLKAIFIIICVNFLLIGKSMERLRIEHNLSEEQITYYISQLTKESDFEHNYPYTKEDLALISNQSPINKTVDKNFEYLTNQSPVVIYRDCIAKPSNYSTEEKLLFGKPEYEELYLEEAENICSPEKPFRSYIQQALDYFFGKTITNLTAERIKEQREKLYSLKREEIRNFALQIRFLSYFGDCGVCAGQTISFIKYLIWNRIMLFKEVFNQLYLDNFKVNSESEYSIDKLQILLAHTQLKKITMEHINALWINSQYMNSSAYKKLKINSWFSQVKRPSVKFNQLILNIFAPTTHGYLPSSAQFEEFFHK